MQADLTSFQDWLTCQYPNSSARKHTMSDLALFFSWAVEGLTSNVSYQYDIANRLVEVNGAAYTWDANGNTSTPSVNATLAE